MKRSRASLRKRKRFECDQGRRCRCRPLLAQPEDERASAPEDARLLAELAWLGAQRHGCIPAVRPASPPG